jgi:Ribbon-helix-helix protein, copG family
VPHRLQITISQTQYAFLDAESARSSVSMAELIRRAIDTTYEPSGTRLVHVISHVLGRRAGVRLRD